MSRVLAFMFAILLPATRGAAGQSAAGSHVSSTAAVVVSVGATLVPVAAGLTMWAGQRTFYDPNLRPHHPDRSRPALVIASGLVWGPSIGYVYGKRPDTGLRWGAARGGVVLLSFLPAFAICGWDCSKGDPAYDKAWLVVATGSGLALASAVYDIVRLKRSLESRPRLNVALGPAYIRGPGVVLHVEF